MATPIITVEHLSKRFRIRHEQAARYTALRDVMTERAKGLFRSGRSRMTTEEFSALDDVSFTVNAGDRVGIIGRNGAGKSTLLKVLSRITGPSAGRVTIDGRVASLLEVGTGFHPELTGRENIFLNGAILGMGRAEIASKFDEIVAFAEVEQFLDTPVKRYSSGMYVRLAFAVAAHLEPEILIVDEVLAVGDAEFQRKCLGKMEQVSGNGRTVLFVSHNMEAVQKLCNTGILLHKGRLVTSGAIDAVVDHYLQSSDDRRSVFAIPRPKDATDRPGILDVARISTDQGQPSPEIPVGRDWMLQIEVTVHRPLQAGVVGAGIVSAMGMPLRTVWSQPAAYAPGQYRATFLFNDIHFTTGLYRIALGFSEQGRTFHYSDNDVVMHISDASDLAGDERIVNTKSGLIIDQADVQIIPL